MIGEISIPNPKSVDATGIRVGRRPRFITLGTSLAVLAVTAAGVAKALSSTTLSLGNGQAVAFGTLAALHALLGSVGLAWIERRGTRKALYLHFAVAILIAEGALALSRGVGFLLVLSLISQSVVYLSLASTVCVTVLYAVTAFVFFGVDGKWPSEAVGVASSIAFVLVFSQLLGRENRARGEVERLAAELADANQRLHAYASAVEELAATKERNRIAREIHDGIGHYLTVVHVQLEAAQATFLPAPAKAQLAISKAQELTREGLAEVRRSVGVLRGAAAETAAVPSLIRAIEKLANECTRDGISAALEVSGQPRPLTEATGTTLFRAAQEALTNVRRHARASHVRIELDFRDSSAVRIEVEDDGAGTANVGHGFGLMGLRERAELGGGRFTASSEPGRGFRLQLELPT
ncbi:MAG TPA: sensor histidine kinase [Polyangiaceae bacterium]|nr:sensor histidine kinase [Polyangiaceae bacterium]